MMDETSHENTEESTVIEHFVFGLIKELCENYINLSPLGVFVYKIWDYTVYSLLKALAVIRDLASVVDIFPLSCFLSLV